MSKKRDRGLGERCRYRIRWIQEADLLLAEAKRREVRAVPKPTKNSRRPVMPKSLATLRVSVQRNVTRRPCITSREQR